MAVARATLIKRIRGRLGDNPWLDVCTEAMDTTETGLNVADTTKWVVGDVLEFQDDGELCLVTALASGTELTVRRNHLLSVTATADTGTTHAINGLVAKRPYFRYHQVTEAITEVIHELWPYVYTQVTATLTPSTTGETHYSVAATFEALSSAVQMTTGVPDKPQFYGGRRSWYPIELVVGLPDNYPDTEDTRKTVWVPRLYNTSTSIFLRGIRRITDTVTSTDYDDVPDGLEAECVMYLVIAELLSSTDVRRVAGSDASMNDQSVTPGRRTALGDSSWYRKGLRRRRQWEEDLRTSLPRLGSYHKPHAGALGIV